jgi:SagB-type dehydrogenase family enzyme
MRLFRACVTISTVALSATLVVGSDGARADPTPASHAPEARRYRDLTSHTPRSVRSNRHRLDWKNKPALYRSYPEAQTVRLPPPQRLTRPALEVIGMSHSADAMAAPVLDLELLGTILFFTGGISGTRQSSGGDVRVTAAAGGLYPNDLYVVTAELPGLSAGLYHYNPKAERLSRLRSGDWRAALAAAAADDRVRRAPATMVISGTMWRTAWKYQDRGYRHLYWDGGMMLAHTLAAAAAVGLPAITLAHFVDAGVDRLIGADGRREQTLALVVLGSDTGPRGPTKSPGPVPPLTLSFPTRSRPVEYPDALRYHTASRLDDADAVRRLRDRPPRTAGIGLTTESVRSLPAAAAARGDASLDAVIRRRRSTRRFAHRPISLADLAAVLERPTRGAPTDFLAAGDSRLETYVIVNAVRDLEPGSYYYRRATHELQLLERGNFRGWAGHLCLGQAICRDASAVLYYLANLEAIGCIAGERGYRLAELEAGLVAGRAYLAAYAIGRGASGMTFYDEEVPRFFGPHAARLEPLLVMAVGRPRKGPETNA